MTLLFLFALAAAVEPPAVAPVAETLVDEIVAWANDDVVLWSDLQDEERQEVARLLEESGVLAPEELSRRVKQLRERVLTQLISSRLMVQEVERLYDLAEIKKDLIKRFKEHQSIKSEEELDQLIAQWRLSRAELEDRLLLGSAGELVVDLNVVRNLSVSEAEARQYFETHRERFATPPQVTFRELVLLAAEPAARAARRADAESVAARIRGGADFVALVRELSEAASRGLDGRIGPLPPSDLTPEIAAAALRTPVGQVSDLIETSQGWHLIRVEERREESSAEFDQVRRECEKAVRQEKFGPAYENYLQGLWRNGAVEVRRAYLDRLPPPWRDLVKPRD